MDSLLNSDPMLFEEAQKDLSLKLFIATQINFKFLVFYLLLS